MWLCIWFVAATTIGFLSWIWSTRHWAGPGSGLLISMLEKLNWFCLTSLVTLLLLLLLLSVLEEESSFKMLGLSLSSKLDWGSYIFFIAKTAKLDWGSYIFFIAKTASKKIGALICSMNFLSSEVVMHLYKFTMWSCMEYCCHVWDSASSCRLELLDKLQNWIWRTVGLSLAASLESFLKSWIVEM